MNNSPLVSIIIPTYNRADLIGATLDSVIAQTYQNWECIVVDDGSTDTTDAVMATYMEKDSRFRYYHRPKDRPSGGNAARNYGLEVSKGAYVQWFDDDDIMLPNLLFLKVNEFLDSAYTLDFILCGLQYFNGKNNKTRIYTINYSDNLIESFLKDKIILNTPVFLFKRDSIGSLTYNENLTRAQDLDFIFRYLKKNKKGVSINKALIQVRVHSDSITFNYKKKRRIDILSELKVRKDMVDYFSKNKGDSYNIALSKYIFHLEHAIQTDIKLGIFNLYTTACINTIFKAKLAFYLIVSRFFYFGHNRLKNIRQNIREN